MQHIEQSGQTHSDSHSFASPNLLVSALAILALMSCWGIFLYLGIGSLLSADASPDPTPPKPAPVNPKPDDEPDETTVKYADAEQAFVLELQRSELKSFWEQTHTALERTRSVASQFDTRLSKLQINDTGRRLAAPKTARRMKFLAEYSEKSDADFDEVQRVLNDVERMINSGLNPKLNIDGLIEKLVRYREQLESDRHRMETVDRAIDELLADNQVAQSSTLKDAIDRLTAADASAIQQHVNAKVASERSAQATQIQSESMRRTALEKDLQTARAKLQGVIQQREDSR